MLVYSSMQLAHTNYLHRRPACCRWQVDRGWGRTHYFSQSASWGSRVLWRLLCIRWAQREAAFGIHNGRVRRVCRAAKSFSLIGTFRFGQCAPHRIAVLYIILTLAELAANDVVKAEQLKHQLEKERSTKMKYPIIHWQNTCPMLRQRIRKLSLEFETPRQMLLLQSRR